MYGLGHEIRANRVDLYIWNGYPYACGVWFTFKVPFSSNELRDGLANFLRGCRSLFSDKADPKMCNIWHQMLKIASVSGVQTQLRSLRRSPYLLPSRNSQSQLWPFVFAVTPTWTFE